MLIISQRKGTAFRPQFEPEEMYCTIVKYHGESLWQNQENKTDKQQESCNMSHKVSENEKGVTFEDLSGACRGILNVTLNVSEFYISVVLLFYYITAEQKSKIAESWNA